MGLRFSRTADYALRATLEIARGTERELATCREIAHATNAPASTLAQVLAALARDGVLVAQAGPKGGYRLARPAREIAVYDVVTAIDGEVREERCVLREDVCSWEGACPFHPVMVRAQERFRDTLRETSIADVLFRYTGAMP